MLATLAYVDDIIDLTNSTEDCKASHESALLFSAMKKLILSATKCYNMVINQDAENQPIELEIEYGKLVQIAEEITYLGDVFNCKGNNDGLIQDTVK